MVTLSIALIVAIVYTNFQAIINNTNVVLIVKGEPSIMSAIDQLLTYIRKLTPEQVEKLLRHLPRLVELLEEPANEKEEYISSITKALYKTNDIALLDLILQLLQKSRKA